MGPGPTSGHWPRATAGGPSSWREKGQVTQSGAQPPQQGVRNRGELRLGRESREFRVGFGERPESWEIWWMWG